MRKLATQNSAEIRDAVEDGKRRHRVAGRARQGLQPSDVRRSRSSGSTAATAANARRTDARDGRGRHDPPSRAPGRARAGPRRARRSSCATRLREIYKSQGIEVPDRIIDEGIKALKESRFVYTPPPPSLGRTLAIIWIRRHRILGIIAAIIDRRRGALGRLQIRHRSFPHNAPPKPPKSNSPRRCPNRCSSPTTTHCAKRK